MVIATYYIVPLIQKPNHNNHENQQPLQLIQLNRIPSLVALALAGSAWATSPYDTAYGLQWNFQIGTSAGVAWTRTIENPLDPTNLKNDQVLDTAFGTAGDGVYVMVATSGQWNNTNGYTYLGSDDVLVHKMVPGDFNADGLVDFADVQIAGSGKLYLDGDIDFDADVDTTDLTAVAGAFTRAKAPGKWTNGTAGATLRCRASDGQVWLHASEAAGGIVTSFQLENAAGTFVAANYAGPAGGSFGGGLKEATPSVLADTDLTLAGVSGIVSLGPVFPTGLDQAGLEVYLKTAVYTGQPGSGQMQFSPVVAAPSNSYATWTAGPRQSRDWTW